MIKFRKEIFIGLLIIIIPGITSIFVIFGNILLNYAIILSLLLLVVIFICAIRMNKAQKYKGILTPTNLFSLIYILLYFVMAYDLLFLRGYSSNNDLLETLIEALLLALLGYLFFFVGFIIPIGKKLSCLLPNLEFKWNSTLTAIVSIVLLIISTISCIMEISETGGIIAHLSQLDSRRLLFFNHGYLLLLDNLSLLNLYMIFAYWLDTRKGILLLAISFVSTLFILVINGSRISFLVVILVLLIIYAYKGNKVSWTVLASILLIFAIWAVVYGAYTREILPYGGLVYGGITDLQTGNAPVLSTYLMTFWNRLAPLNFDSLSHLVFILEQVPMNHDFLYGKSILGILAYSVPRILFPDKPYPIGMLFTQVFFPNTFLNGSGVTPSLLVDFYWNFGIPGIMLGMLGFGILIRTFNNYAENYKFQLGALICLALVGSHIFGWLKAGSDTPTQDILSLLIPWIIISGIIFKIKK